MSTSYVVSRHNGDITRQQVIQQFPDSFVHTDNEAKGLTVNDDIDICITDGIDYAWLSFVDDKLIYAEIYGRNYGSAVDELNRRLDIEMIDEHNEEFHYHCFPIDVKNDTPHYVINEWKLFVVDQYAYVYNCLTNMYYYPENDPIFNVIDSEKARQLIEHIKSEY